MKKLQKHKKQEIIDSLQFDASELFSFLEIAGLRDITGRKIHFGDILVDNFDNLLTPVIEIEKGEHILFFKPLNLVKSKLHIGCKSTYSNTLLVIDNIFEDLAVKDLQ